MFLATAAAAFLAATSVGDPVEAFGRMPLLAGIEASPDGKHFAAIVRSEGQSGLGVFVLDGGFRYTRFIQDQDSQKIRDFFWKADDRLVFSASVPGLRYGTPVTETRMFSLEPEGDDIVPLYRTDRRSQFLPPQIQDRVVSTLPDDPQNILVQYPAPGTNDTMVFKVRVDRSTRHRGVRDPMGDSRHWMADRDGNLRVVYGLRDEKERTLRVLTPDGKWKDLSDRLEGDGRFIVAGLSTDPDIVYVISDHDSDVAALYSFSVTQDAFVEELFRHPTSDVFDVALSPKDGRLIGAVYAEEEPETYWFGDSIARKLINAVRQATGEDSVVFHSINMSGNTAVLRVSSGIRPGRYVVFSFDDGQLQYLPSQYPALEDAALGEVIATSYEARDGLDIPAFVTLPPGIASLESAKALPFIVMPHGGPTARDFRGFDWLAQFLAHRGFGVLQMNFRGSSGYGGEFKAAGDREWGQAMQDDITDGTRWLFEQGVADPQKTSILGASYGGYAALMGAVKTPDLFRCSVAINGVSDLQRLISDANDYIDGTYSTRHIGRLWGDRGMLRENSPALRADEVKVPVLLIHGEDDRVVPLAQSIRMRRALERADKDVTYVELEDGSHFLNVNDNRVTALRAIDDFLGRCR